MSQPLTALEKALVVLEAAASHPTFSEITAETGLAKATVHRILSTLVERQFLVLTPHGRYLPGPRFLALTGVAFQEIDITALVEPLAINLADKMQCTVHVGTRVGDEIVYIVRADSNKPYQMPSRVGATTPLHSSGIGKAVLAQLPDDEIKRIVSRVGLRRLTARTITRQSDLMGEIRTIRRDGFAHDREENVPGVICIAASITDYTRRAQHAVSITSLSLEHTEEELEAMVPDLLDTAQAMTAAIGGSPASIPLASSIRHTVRNHHDNRE